MGFFPRATLVTVYPRSGTTGRGQPKLSTTGVACLCSADRRRRLAIMKTGAARKSDAVLCFDPGSADNTIRARSGADVALEVGARITVGGKTYEVNAVDTDIDGVTGRVMQYKAELGSLQAVPA